VRGLWLLGAVLAGLARCHAVPAFAHGDAAWIQATPAMSRSTGSTHCCGPTDCRRMTEDEALEVKPIPGGWRFRGVDFLEERAGLYRSEDNDLWFCEFGGGPKCLFVRPEGS
jgi:hypothetical protein